MTPLERRHFLIYELQLTSTGECGWETVLTPHYEDFDITDEYCEFIGAKCCQFLQCLQERAAGEDYPCFQVTTGQGEDERWAEMRCWMVTASRAKRLSVLTSPSAKASYLLSELWRRDGVSVVTPAMEYGTTTEPVARVAYLVELRRMHPNSTIVETGLWAMQQYPQLGCSPDGLVEIDDGETRLLEIKCPHTLKNVDPHRFESVLDKEHLNRFYLTRDKEGSICLKKTHEYYYQIQMCLGVHMLDVCDFFIYSPYGHVLIPVQFEANFWESLKAKLLQVQATLILPEYFSMRTVRGLKPMSLPKRYLPVLYKQSGLD